MMRENNSYPDQQIKNDHNNTPLVGVSSCLMGEPVRFDGNHKKNEFITEQLKNRFNFVSICPEVAIGMGVPRQPVRLVKDKKNIIRSLGVRDSSLDVTDGLHQYAGRVSSTLDRLSGYVFKKDSPSCGVFRVKVYNHSGMPERSGRGVFAAEVLRAYPNLPVEEEGRLNDAALKENFMMRVSIYHDWQRRVNAGLTTQSFEEFHRIHKFTLLAHDQRCYRQLGKFVAGCTKHDLNIKSEHYIAEFMRALKNIPTVDQNINVIMHIMGFLKRDISATDKAELIRAMDRYRAGNLSSEVPLALISHHLRRYPNQYLSSQHYLNHSMPI